MRPRTCKHTSYPIGFQSPVYRKSGPPEPGWSLCRCQSLDRREQRMQLPSLDLVQGATEPKRKYWTNMQHKERHYSCLACPLHIREECGRYHYHCLVNRFLIHEADRNAGWYVHTSLHWKSVLNTRQVQLTFPYICRRSPWMWLGWTCPSNRRNWQVLLKEMEDPWKAG